MRKTLLATLMLAAVGAFSASAMASPGGRYDGRDGRHSDRGSYRYDGRGHYDGSRFRRPNVSIRADIRFQTGGFRADFRHHGGRVLFIDRGHRGHGGHRSHGCHR